MIKRFAIWLGGKYGMVIDDGKDPVVMSLFLKHQEEIEQMEAVLAVTSLDRDSWKLSSEAARKRAEDLNDALKKEPHWLMEKRDPEE